MMRSSWWRGWMRLPWTEDTRSKNGTTSKDWARSFLCIWRCSKPNSTSNTSFRSKRRRRGKRLWQSLNKELRTLTKRSFNSTKMRPKSTVVRPPHLWMVGRHLSRRCVMKKVRRTLMRTCCCRIRECYKMRLVQEEPVSRLTSAKIVVKIIKCSQQSYHSNSVMKQASGCQCFRSRARVIASVCKALRNSKRKTVNKYC